MSYYCTVTASLIASGDLTSVRSEMGTFGTAVDTHGLLDGLLSPRK